MNVGRTSRKDHQLAPLRRFVVVLPVELGASLIHVVAIKNPGQHPVHRFGGLIADGPIAVPSLEPFPRGVVLEVEDRIHKQALLRAALPEQRPLLQIALQAGRHPPQDQLREGKGFGFRAINRHQADVGALFRRFPLTLGPEGHTRPL